MRVQISLWWWSGVESFAATAYRSRAWRLPFLLSSCPSQAHLTPAEPWATALAPHSSVC